MRQPLIYRLRMGPFAEKKFAPPYFRISENSGRRTATCIPCARRTRRFPESHSKKGARFSAVSRTRAFRADVRPWRMQFDIVEYKDVSAIDRGILCSWLLVRLLTASASRNAPSPRSPPNSGALFLPLSLLQTFSATVLELVDAESAQLRLQLMAVCPGKPTVPSTLSIAYSTLVRPGKAAPSGRFQ